MKITMDKNEIVKAITEYAQKSMATGASIKDVKLTSEYYLESEIQEIEAVLEIEGASANAVPPYFVGSGSPLHPGYNIRGSSSTKD